MKMLLFISTIIVLVFTGVYNLNSKTPEFTLLAKSGKVEYKANKKSWKSIKSNQEFWKWDRIRLKKDSYACLVCKDGRIIELMTEYKTKTYTVSELRKKLKKSGGGLSAKFADYIVEEMSDTDEFFSEDNYREDMGTTGAVNRAKGGKVNTKSQISSMTGDDETSELLNAVGSAFLDGDDSFIVTRMPGNSYLLDKKVNFSWYRNPNVSVYVFYLKDRHNKKLLQQNIMDTSITIDLSSVSIIKGENYYWHVSDKDGDSMSDEYCLQWLTSSFGETVQDTVNMILSGFGGINSPMGNLAVARYYADKNIMNRAYNSYKRATELAPDAKKYQLLLAKYLDRIGLCDEAKTLVKK